MIDTNTTFTRCDFNVFSTSKLLFGSKPLQVQEITFTYCIVNSATGV